MEITTLAIITLLLLIFIQTTLITLNSSKPALKNKGNGRPILLDTSVIMDGRIVGLAESGFIGDTLFVPRSVIGELQLLADTGDSDKRAKARAGLDIVKFLQDLETVQVEILQDGSIAREGVDERLLTLAKQYSAAICTLDYNLNKVAQVEGIAILNINELAQNLRIAYLPGEKMTIEIVQIGNAKQQGVGYIDDGTMVVVENASGLIGKKIEVECIRALQTAAGKMLFAKVSPDITHEDKPEKKPARGRKPILPVLRKKENDTPPVVKSNKQVAKPKKESTEKIREQPNRQRKNNRPKTAKNQEDSLIQLVNNQK